MANAQDQCNQELLAIIGETFACARGLRNALELERNALEQQDPNLLDIAGEQKQRKIVAFEALDADRRSLCEAYSFGSDSIGMEKLLIWCDRDATLDSQWRKLLVIVEDCRNTNTTNGAIVQRRRAQVLGALSLLRGEAPGAGLYGPTGEANTAPQQRALAEV